MTLSQESHPNILWLLSSQQKYSQHVSSAIQNAGGNPISFDYLKSLDVAENDIKHAEESDLFPLNKRQLAEALVLPNSKSRQRFLKSLHTKSDKILRKTIEAFIDKHNITGIFLPGDYYNYDAHPFHPEPRERPRYSKILVDIAKERRLPVFGTCGGLQAIAYAEDIKIKRVKEMTPSTARNHTLSETHTDRSATFLSQNTREELVVSQTKLAKTLRNITRRLGLNTQGGPQHLYIPEAHGGAIDNSWNNKIQLEKKGYKINIYSPDGIIQGLEHTEYPIIGFQGHPEALAAQNEPVTTSLLKDLLIIPAKNKAQELDKKTSKITTMVDRISDNSAASMQR